MEHANFANYASAYNQKSQYNILLNKYVLRKQDQGN